MSVHKVKAVLVFNCLLEHLPIARQRIMQDIQRDLGNLADNSKANIHHFANVQKMCNERLQTCIDSFELQNELLCDAHPTIEIEGTVK